MNRPGLVITVAPPASASEHSPWRNACAARCIATNDDEHAVSTDTAGPSSPKVYEIRPDAMLWVLPLAMNASNSAGTLGSRMM